MPAFNCFGSPGDVQNGILPLFLLSPAAALAVRLALVRMPHFSLSTAAAASGPLAQGASPAWKGSASTTLYTRIFERPTQRGAKCLLSSSRPRAML